MKKSKKNENDLNYVYVPMLTWNFFNCAKIKHKIFACPYILTNTDLLQQVVDHVRGNT
jgi:hypothetical protein